MEPMTMLALLSALGTLTKVGAGAHNAGVEDKYGRDLAGWKKREKKRLEIQAKRDALSRVWGKGFELAPVEGEDAPEKPNSMVDHIIAGTGGLMESGASFGMDKLNAKNKAKARALRAQGQTVLEGAEGKVPDKFKMSWPSQYDEWGWS